MKVLVLGATGFIGFPAAQALVRAGHYVIGQTRSYEKAKQLAAEEIIPLVSEVSNPAAWINIVKDLDAVIDCVGGTPEIETFAETTRAAVSGAAQKLRPHGSPKLNNIYTSVELVAWRVEQEQHVIKDTVLNGLVVRPGVLYGRSGSLFSRFFQDASEGYVWYPETSGARLAGIHTDDLADLYVKAAEKAVICGGLIIDAVNDRTESADDVLATLVKVSGAKGPYEYKEPTNTFEVALGATALLRPHLAKSLLGWQVRKPGLVDGLSVYYEAWKASQ